MLYRHQSQTPKTIRRQLERVHQGKAAGLDHISPEVLCSPAFWHPATHHQPEPVAGKDTGAMEDILVSTGSKTVSDCRPVALTSPVFPYHYIMRVYL